MRRAGKYADKQHAHHPPTKVLLGCSKCGATLPDEAQFCLKCGKPVSSPPQNEPRSWKCCLRRDCRSPGHKRRRCSLADCLAILIPVIIMGRDLSDSRRAARAGVCRDETGSSHPRLHFFRWSAYFPLLQIRLARRLRERGCRRPVQIRRPIAKVRSESQDSGSGQKRKLISTTTLRSTSSPSPPSRSGRMDTRPVLSTRAARLPRVQSRRTFRQARASTISSSATSLRRKRPRLFMRCPAALQELAARLVSALKAVCRIGSALTDQPFKKSLSHVSYEPP